MSALQRRLLAAGAVSALGLATPPAAPAATAVRVQHGPAVRENVGVTFLAKPLAEGGYYYGVMVLKPYRRYTRSSPPRCSTSSNMQRTDYGYPQADGRVALALTPARSPTGHWCPGGSYEGAVYAVPHAPPCESAYPCQAQPDEAPCAGVRPGCVEGVVARPLEYAYPDGLPAPRATDAQLVARFTVRFPNRPAAGVRRGD